MPTQIDCPDCLGSGKAEYKNTWVNRCGCKSCVELKQRSTDCKNPDCKDGKITVYIKAELQKAVEDCAIICDEIASMFSGEKWDVARQCAEAIRDA